MGIRHDALGMHALGRLEYEVRDGEVVFMDGGPVRVMVTEEHVGATTEPTMRDLSEALVAVYGTDYGIHSPTWISRFTDMTRQAAAYREGRVLLAGDAAHVHAPDGGQGLQTGVQDAVNLGWKLAQVVNRTSPESLLDTYHAERHPVAARVLRNTMAHVALRRPDERTKALRDTIAELLSMDEPRRGFAAMMSGLDIHHDLGVGHPLLGRRMPDLDLVTADGSLRVFTLLHDARPVLLNLGEPGGFDIAPWSAALASWVAAAARRALRRPRLASSPFASSSAVLFAGARNPDSVCGAYRAPSQSTVSQPVCCRAASPISLGRYECASMPARRPPGGSRRSDVRRMPSGPAPSIWTGTTSG